MNNNQVMVDIGNKSKSVVVKLKDIKIYLKGMLEDIFSDMNKRGFEPTLSSLEDGVVEIWFPTIDYVDDLMKQIIPYSNSINNPDYVRETLFEFISFKNPLKMEYHELEDDGFLYYSVILTFPMEELPRFSELYFEVFPKDKPNMEYSQ